MNVVSKGAGQAVLGLDVEFGIDYDPLREFPPVDAFALTVNESYSKWRNASLIDVTACTKYVIHYTLVPLYLK